MRFLTLTFLLVFAALPCTAQDVVDEVSRLPMRCDAIGAVRHQASSYDPKAGLKDRGQSVLERKSNDKIAIADGGEIGGNQ